MASPASSMTLWALGCLLLLIFAPHTSALPLWPYGHGGGTDHHQHQQQQPLMPLSPGAGFADPYFGGLLERALDRAFSHALDLTGAAGEGGRRTVGSLVPNLFRAVAGGTAMDIHETDKEYTIRADAPGFKPDEVFVEERDGVLTVRGTKEEKKEDKDKQGNVIRQEREFRSFIRSFTLPDTAQADQISAALEHGLLTVRVPKKEAAKRVVESRRIPIAGGSGGAAASSVDGVAPGGCSSSGSSGSSGNSGSSASGVTPDPVEEQQARKSCTAMLDDA